MSKKYSITDSEIDSETQSILDTVLPFVSRERIRGKTRDETHRHLTDITNMIIEKVYKCEQSKKKS